MNHISPYQYLLIDIANHAGMDKLSWRERIQWTKDNIANLEGIVEVDNTFSYIASVNALREVERGNPTGRLVSLDATASFLQILAVMSGCYRTAYQCNLTDSGSRQDFYTNLVVAMNLHLPKELHIGFNSNLTRDDVKSCAMPVFYGSMAMPKKVFGEDTPELAAFYQALEDLVPAALEVMGILRTCWDNHALFHQWVLPDGHTSRVKVMELVKKRIEVDELDHSTFTYQTEVNQASNSGISLLANVIQSFDGYIVREVIRRCAVAKIEVLTIHDSFHCHPNHMHQLRSTYQEILVEMSQSNLLEDVYNQLKSSKDTYTKKSEDLYKDILKAEYFLS